MEASTSYCVRLPEQPMDCSFHPSEQLVAAGIITGQVRVSEYDGTSTTRRSQKRLHSESCRAVQFSSSGDCLLTGSADKSLVVLDTGTCKVQKTYQDAHPAGVSRLLALSESTFASGDDDGLIKTWDQRQVEPSGSFDAHTDFVSDMVLHDREQCLVAVSGDGTLTVNDLRTGKIRAQSENDADDELLSVAIMKGDRKVVAGTQSGVVNLYSWGHMDDCSDRFPGHPSSVDALVKYDADTIITGSSDGIIRIINILPNRMLAVLGGTEELPIERLALSHDRATLASVSHESCLRLWDLSQLAQESEDEEEETHADQEEGNGVSSQEGTARLQGDVSATVDRQAQAVSDDEDEGQQQGKKGKRDRGKGQHKVPKRQKGSSSGFFADLL
ncbi:hypothetical protein ABBQ38_015474 [Trebouxia sp. C0009 RCD-2024]